MKRFTFRLQRILEIKERIRDERRQELVLKNLERDRAQQHLEYLEQEYSRSQIAEGGTYSASDLLLLGNYAVRLKEEISQQALRVEAAQRAAEEARERYIEASKESQAMEKLKERRKQEYQEQVLKDLGNQLDEFGVQRAVRRTQTERR
jgi:flagellar FliJ protein